MIRKVELKVSTISGDSKGRRNITMTNDRSFEDEEPQQTDELDYRVFKTFLITSSPESHQNSYLKAQSSLRFSEYKAFTSNSHNDVFEAQEIQSGMIQKQKARNNFDAIFENQDKNEEDLICKFILIFL